MAHEKTYNNRLQGMTLPEVLVVMIVSAIVFLNVMDGFGLFQRHAQNISERLIDNIEFYDGYYRLENIITSADSLTGNNTKIYCWQNGCQDKTLTLNDGKLIAAYSHINDTLMRQVDRMTAYVKYEQQEILDSITIVVMLEADKLSVSFVTNIPAQVDAKQNIEKNEKIYEYK